MSDASLHKLMQIITTDRRKKAAVMVKDSQK